MKDEEQAEDRRSGEANSKWRDYGLLNSNLINLKLSVEE
jgi:hypothetical protein